MFGINWEKWKSCAREAHDKVYPINKIKVLLMITCKKYGIVKL